MAWIQAANGNVFEVEDVDHVAKILREAPQDKTGKALHSAWETDPREKGAKPFKLSVEADSDSE